MSKLWLIRLILAASSFVSGMLILNRLNSYEFLLYMHILSLYYIAAEFPTLGGNVESYRNGTPYNYLSTIKKRAFLGAISGVALFFCLYQDVSVVLAILISCLPLLSFSTSIIQTDLNLYHRFSVWEFSISAFALVARFFFDNDLSSFVIIFASEATLKYFSATLLSAKAFGFRTLFVKGNVKAKGLFGEEVLFGLGLFFLIVVNRLEAIIFKGNNDDTLAAILAVAYPLASINYLIEIIGNRNSVKVQRAMFKYLAIFLLVGLLCLLTTFLKNLTINQGLTVLMLTGLMVISSMVFTDHIIKLSGALYLDIILGRLLMSTLIYCALGFVGTSPITSIILVQFITLLISILFNYKSRENK